MSEAHANLGPYNGFGFEIPFVLSLGIELHEFADGASLLRFAPEACHLNSFDVVHGGALMTLLDVTLATAARSVAPDNGILTIEMKTSFMQPAKGPLTGRGRLIHRTKSLAFTEGTVFNAEGQACVHATGTFRYVRRDQSQPQSHKPPTD